MDYSYNSLPSLNISTLTKLTHLYCDSNGITALEVANLVNLKKLYCSNNTIIELDVTNLTKLTNLNCFYNLLDQFNAEAIATAIRTHPSYTGSLGISAQKNGTTIDTTTSPFTALQTAQYSWTIYL